MKVGRAQLFALGCVGCQLGCGHVSGFLQADKPRTTFERGYFAEMSAVEGYAAARPADAVRVLVDQHYQPRQPGSVDPRSNLLDVIVPLGLPPPWPILVYAHGGGMNAGDKDDETQVNRNLCIALAQRGFAVLNINHRLARDAKHPAQVKDMAAAVRWAVDHGAAFGGDPHRIGLLGFSSGGYLAALLAADTRYLRQAGVDPGRVRSVVAISGFFDLQHLASRFLVRRNIVEPAFGSSPTAWRAASPVTYAGAHWPAALLITAAEDR